MIGAAQESRRSRQRFDLLLDRINSGDLIRQARLIYCRYLHGGGSPNPAPKGVVLTGVGGRVVFDWPTLLPAEQFIPGEWLHGRPAQPPGRAPKNRGSAEQPQCTTPLC